MGQKTKSTELKATKPNKTYCEQIKSNVK